MIVVFNRKWFVVFDRVLVLFYTCSSVVVCRLMATPCRACESVSWLESSVFHFSCPQVSSYLLYTVFVDYCLYWSEKDLCRDFSFPYWQVQSSVSHEIDIKAFLPLFIWDARHCNCFVEVLEFFRFHLECEDLIKRMLTIDPVKRASVEEILSHRWVKLAGEDPEFDKLISQSFRPPQVEDEPLNELVLQHMQSLDIDRDQTIKVSLWVMTFYVF